MNNGQELQSCAQASHQGEQNQSLGAPPIQDAVSVSASSNDSRKVSRQDIELVQNLIERCLQLYMNRDEVVKTLLARARIDPGFTRLVWQKLEEENADFFRAYYIRLKLKKQIILFNHLLEHQYHLMRYPPLPPKIPLAPIPNGMHPMAPGVNMPMGYPVLQHPQMHVQGHPHIDAMGMSSCHVVNGVPAPANFQPLKMNSTNDMVIDTNVEDATTQVIPPNSGGMSEMEVSPASVASSGHFPFDASDMVMDASVLDSAFTSEEGGGSGNARDSLRSFDQIPWNFSISDLTADLSSLGGKLQL
ncbi:Helicase with zinc finger protein [Hirschfeldia incana]|nr:Helicase with zinc finger protein [Hirschfeldia incana]